MSHCKELTQAHSALCAGDLSALDSFFELISRYVQEEEHAAKDGLRHKIKDLSIDYGACSLIPEDAVNKHGNLVALR